MERPVPCDMMARRDQERDLELDKKIEALRRKNEALMKRYKEVEEDKKRAEEEGVALQSRAGKADDLTITISKSSNDGRVVVTKPIIGSSPASKGQQEEESDRGEEASPQSTGRGHKKQLMVTMAGKKGKRLVSERSEKKPGPAEVKNPSDEGQMKSVETVVKGKQPRLVAKKDKAAQGDVKQDQAHGEEHILLEDCQEPESPQGSTDLNIPTSKEEQEAYLRWKKEREQIDRERVARHKNAKGQWRRAWDMDKTENMFSDKSITDRDWGPTSRGGRSARRGQQRFPAESSGISQGHDKRGKEKGAKNVQVMCSKAKGKDRLTGRARRWQDNEGAKLQTSDTTLEEFLEELNALTETSPEAEDQKKQDYKIKFQPSPDLTSRSEEASRFTCSTVTVALTEDDSGKADASPPQAPEKKVCFSEELIYGPHTRQITVSQDSASSSSLKAPSSSKTKHEVQGSQPCADITEDKGISARSQAPETGCSEKDFGDPTTASSPCAEVAHSSVEEKEASVQPVEVTKCNISSTNPEDLIDSGLSVLSLESGETHPAQSASSDKAREHGKIV